MRCTVHVRDAVAADLPALMQLFEQLRSEPARVRLTSTPRVGVDERFLAAMGADDERVLVAEATTHDGDCPRPVVGMAMLGLGPASLMTSSQSVLMSNVLVLPSARRHGAGRAFVQAAATWAEQRGVDAVAVTVFPGDRDVHRFYARLGFAPIAVRRLAPLPLLQRRLGMFSTTPALPPVPGVGGDVSRRGLRARMTTNRVLAERRRAAAPLAVHLEPEMRHTTRPVTVPDES